MSQVKPQNLDAVVMVHISFKCSFTGSDTCGFACELKKLCEFS